ncbi:gamma-glutamyltransferase family protein [Calothrix rhizosoleniae]|uniref:gamma-glutamyltransferase family protein n=1 Tax=Calothrix rhizosoleniae TaxID=888997 RepID=UPI00190EB1F7|nr:gamma-glutamyltransferase [Calothrix rhizosoleniae]
MSCWWGIFLAHRKNQENILFDFFTQTPQQKKATNEIDFYPTHVNFGDAVQTFHIGLGSMAVPGNIKGVFEVHKKLGKLPLNVVAEPAIHYAEHGLEINDFQAYCLQLLKPIIFASPEARIIYAPNGNLKKSGEILILKDLAASLKNLVAMGEEYFYAGDIAEKIIQDCREHGGYLTREDLQNYRVINRKPLTINYRDYTIITNPPPSAGGILIAFSLGLLSSISFTGIKFGDRKHLQILAEVMHLTNQARENEYHQVCPGELSANHNLQFYQQKLNNVVNKWGSTTHISVMDGEGNAASVTTSNGEGSGYMIPGTGIMMNNMLGEADLNPNGFHQWQDNQRISSMMSPTILLKNGHPEIVLGSGGSNRIRTAILQVISNLVDWQMPITDAITSPRCHWENYQFDIEPGFDLNDLATLRLPNNTKSRLWQEKICFWGCTWSSKNSEWDDIRGRG